MIARRMRRCPARVTAAALTALAALVLTPPLAAGSGRWTPAGPDLGEGGEVLALAIDPTAPGTLWASAFRAGVFRSTDGARSWAAANGNRAEPVGLQVLRGLVPDPWTPGTLWAFGPAGVLRTGDGGASWEPRNRGLPAAGGRPMVRSLALDPTLPGRLLAVAEVLELTPFGFAELGCLYQSLDGGETWVLLSEELDLSRVLLDPFSPDTLYATTSPAAPGVYKSSDGGVTWEEASFGLPPNRFVGDLDPDPSRPDILWATTSEGVFRSRDGGESWEVSLADLRQPVAHLTVAPSRPDTVYVAGGSGGALWRTINGGESWQTLRVGSAPEGDPGPLATAVAVDPTSPETVYVASQSPATSPTDGVFKTVDGGQTWERRVDGLEARVARVLALERHPGEPGTLYAVLEDHGVFKTNDAGASWRRIERGLDQGLLRPDLAVATVDPDRLYLAAYDLMGPPRVFRSRDAGANWEPAGAGPCRPGDFTPSTLEVDPADPETVLLFGDIVCRSTDGGGTWLAPEEPPAFIVRSSAATRDPPVDLYAGGTDRLFQGGPFSPAPQARLARSLDGGLTWARIDGGLEVAESAEHITLDPADPTRLYVETSGGGDDPLRFFEGFESSDGGATWGPVRPDFGGSAPFDLTADPDDPRVRWAATLRGVLKSTDGGATWEPRSNGLVEPGVTRLLLAPGAPPTLWAATGAGVFTLTDGCQEGPTTLCLADGRFAVAVEWATTQGTRGTGRAVPLSADTGYFWFFNSDNVELVVKVLDACSFAQRFWVFAGGLTDVEVRLAVTDTGSGEVRTYSNPQRTPFQPLQDTGAFATCP